MDNCKIMIKVLRTKCLHVACESPRIVFLSIESVAISISIKQGGVKASAIHWETVH